MSADELLADAVSLAPTERAKLAHELLITLHEQQDDDAGWVEEIRRRCREVEDGTAKLEDWAVVRERIMRRLSDKARRRLVNDQ